MQIFYLYSVKGEQSIDKTGLNFFSIECNTDDFVFLQSI